MVTLAICVYVLVVGLLVNVFLDIITHILVCVCVRVRECVCM